MSIPFRINWTWDCWVTDPRDAGAFVRDYRTVIDALARHRFDALIIWGFLRDSHGGIDAARQVARHAKERGIRLLPGIGIFSYGAVYLEGNHPHNFETHHANHPELRGVAKDGRDTPLCPSKAGNQQWMADGLRWLFETIPEIGGVHFETGDSDAWVCHCPDCRAETAAEEGRGGVHGSLADMARLIPPLGEVVTQCAPDAWNTYATYNCFWYPRGRLDPRCADGDAEHVVPLERLEPLRLIPAEYHANWCKGLWDRFTLEESDRPLTPEPNWLNTWFVGGYALEDRFGFEWQGRWTHRGFFPHVERIRHTCRQLAKAGIQGLNIEGGYRPELLDNALTLAAADYFTSHPHDDFGDFVDAMLSERWGNVARDVWDWVEPYEPWVWSIHATIYHLYEVRHLGRRSPFPQVDLAGATGANRAALEGARGTLARAEGELESLLPTAVQRLEEQQIILEALQGDAGRNAGRQLQEWASGGNRNGVIEETLNDLAADLADLPALWR